MTAAAPPPTTMTGFLTTSSSEMIPQRITAMTLNPHIQLPSVLPLCTENPKTVVK